MEKEEGYEYEYVVVGSGAGGGPLAANLAAAGHSVLLLEAGACPQSYVYQVPAFHATSSEDPEMSWEFFVRHYEDEERQLRDWKYRDSEKSRRQGGVFYPRAGTLGGCTAHNAMIFSYPANSDWQGIAELTGDRSWRPKKMRRYFQRLEDCRYRCIQRVLWKLLRLNPSRHGYRGWLASEEADPTLLFEDQELYRLIRNSALINLLKPPRFILRRLWTFIRTFGDPNDWGAVSAANDGLRQTPLTTRGGKRNSSRERVLEAKRKHPDRLTLRLNALVTRVTVERDGGRKRAVGVEYLEGEHLYAADPQHDPRSPGVLRRVKASREVILCGGAFNTPQILQLSGIGPRDVLAKAGIDLVHELRGVGRNLQDRYEVSVVFEMKEPFSMLDGATMRPPEPGAPVDPHFRKWLDGRGIYTTNGAVVSILRRSRDGLPNPDLFLFALVSDFRGYYPGYSERVRDARRYLTWAVLKGHTINRAGTVAVTSPDPRQRPEVHFRYFDEGDDKQGVDRDAVVRGLEIVREITKSYRHLVKCEVQPGEEVTTPEQLARYVEDTAWGHHASCSCPIGADDDPMAVLDSRFRVRGVDGLRVVDASVFPRIPGLFILSAVYMIAEKASDVILEDVR